VTPNGDVGPARRSDRGARDRQDERRSLLAPLIGREREVAAIEACLRRADVRVLVLTGPGGIGKTRLVLHVAETMRQAFHDGVRVVPLAAVHMPVDVLLVIAEEMQIREISGHRLSDTLADALRDRHLLLVLDNFEQVTEAAPLITDLLVRCPRLKALVTSRVPLGVYGEQVYPVSPLTLPAAEMLAPGTAVTMSRIAGSAAVRLFVERARAMRPDFALTDENAPAVSTICHRLDGVPLAIELAAARIGALSPDELAARLERRLPLLTGGPRDRPARFRTMRDSIAWSHELLEPAQKALFRGLAIFVGGFTLAAAEAVKGSATSASETGLSLLDGVSSLVGQSLIQRHEGPGADSRFIMLETIREFAQEQLLASGEADDLARRHAAYFLTLVERAEPELTGPAQVEWLERLEADHANLRAAFGWLCGQASGAAALRFAKAVWRFGYTRGYTNEVRHWLEAALALDLMPSVVRAAALNGAGILATTQGDLARAEQAHLEAQALADRFGDRQTRAAARNGLGDVATARGQLDDAIACYESAQNGYHDAGDQRGIAGTLTNLGNVYWDRGDRERAATLHQQALDLYQTIGERRGVAWSLGNLGRLAIEGGNAEVALPYLRDGLAEYRALSDRTGIAEVVEGMAELTAIRGDPGRGATLLGAASALRAAAGAPVALNDRPHYEEVLRSIRRQLGPAFDGCWQTGRALSLDEASALVDDQDSDQRPELRPVVASGERPQAVAKLDLTPRQLDVLRLLVEGKPDAEIAKDLFIGTRTVQTHLANLYTKLGVNSRAAAAAHAVREHLID
jgi:predicted ATPase/DNA-binding CsgD family transcriptional regulator